MDAVSKYFKLTLADVNKYTNEKNSIYMMYITACVYMKITKKSEDSKFITVTKPHTEYCLHTATLPSTILKSK